MDDTTKEKVTGLIGDMRKFIGHSHGDTSQNPLVAEIRLILAEEQAKSAQKLEEQTGSLIFFTKVLVSLTVALFLLTAYLSYDAYLKNKAIDQAQHSSIK
jgi:cytochrome c-type biogenesis protein CcmH/NrfG